MTLESSPHEHKTQEAQMALKYTSQTQEKTQNLNSLRPETNALELDTHISLEELVSAIKILKVAKSPGRNGIRSETIKWIGTELKLHLLKVFNDCWTGHSPIPREWVDSQVICIYRGKGPETNLANYRPIFLLNTIGKIYASIIMNRLTRKLAESLPKAQYGFREGRSVEQAILGVRTIIQKAIDQRKELVLVFVDLRKAFDSLPVNAIIKRLIELRCSWNLVNLLRSPMASPKRTIYGGKESFEMQKVVRQGSKEGPLLFNLTFQMILEEALQPLEDCAVKMTTKSGTKWKLSHIVADDLCILAPTTQAAEKLLEGLIITQRKYDMEVAGSKTTWMHIKTEEAGPNQLAAAGMNFKKCKITNYLGLQITETLDPDETLKANILKAKKSLIRLRPILRTANL